MSAGLQTNQDANFNGDAVNLANEEGADSEPINRSRVKDSGTVTNIEALEAGSASSNATQSHSSSARRRPKFNLVS